MCVELEEFDSLEASCISAKIKQMFLIWILIQILVDVIKNRKRNGEKNTKENTFALHPNISIFHRIHF